MREYVYTVNMATLMKKNSRGKTYWQIVESRRVNGKPRPVVLMHLGSAEKIMQRLQNTEGSPVKARVYEFGAIAALWALAERLNLVERIDRHAPKRNQGLSCGQYMLLAAINRCVAATSKSSMYDWYQTTVLTRLMPTSKKSLAPQRFWDHMGYLDEATIEAIEDELTECLLDEWQVDRRMLLWDATNFDTFIDTQTNGELAQRGRAKSKRYDLRVIGLALLASTDFNLPLLSSVYPGNQNDVTLFSNAMQRLTARYERLAGQAQELTLVFDGGNNSHENIIALEGAGYRFITSLTLTDHRDLLEVPLGNYEEFADERLDGTNAYHARKDIWGKERVVIVTRSETLLQGQLNGIHAVLTKKRQALRELKEKLHRRQKPEAKGRGKGYTADSIRKRLNKIISGQYIKDILKAEVYKTDGRLDFSFRTDQAAFDRLQRERLGKRIYCTNNLDWSTEQIILGGRSQYHIENAFKQMKDPHWVSFCPTFHWTDQRLRVHAFYCLLALLLTSLLRREAEAHGLDLSVDRLYTELSGIREVVNLYGNGRGRPRAEYVITEQNPTQQQLYDIFALDRLVKS